ncbi:hypothetical protein E2C01_039212 [Portunus trituberculatus]|uniref:Uncharacterized protein n=1 Tax=Portunus trituberculatus TaxID=210409 RepID=A0A5B7FG96_PORTR|nr:hypothetical protein [Portunus trituberculatus]
MTSGGSIVQLRCPTDHSVKSECQGNDTDGVTVSLLDLHHSVQDLTSSRAKSEYNVFFTVPAIRKGKYKFKSPLDSQQ